MDIKPVTWSHSSLKDFETCARKYHEVKILKNYPREETEATLYGTQLHAVCEEYIKLDAPLPPGFEFLQDTLDVLKNKPGRKLTEHEMAVDIMLRPCGFKSPDAWARGIADLLIINDEDLTAWVFDYKSGNDKYPDTDQLTLMSLMVFAHFPHIRLVRSGLLFVLRGTAVKHRVELHDAAEHWWKYRERVARIEDCQRTGVWNPKQSGLCRRYCPVTSCEYNGRR